MDRLLERFALIAAIAVQREQKRKVVRMRLWWPGGFAMSRSGKEHMKIPTARFERLTDALCYAA
jgi:hypothetical protein